MKCNKCKGSGKTKTEGTLKTCPDCKGQGTLCHNCGVLLIGRDNPGIKIDGVWTTVCEECKAKAALSAFEGG